MSPVAARVVVGLLAATAVAVVIGVVMLWPSYRTHAIPIQFQSSGGGATTTVTGTVVAQSYSSCMNPQSGVVFSGDASVLADPQGPCLQNTVALTSGRDKGANTLIEVPTNRASSQASTASQQLTPEQKARPQAGQPTLSVGDHIRLTEFSDPSGARRYAFYDFSRGTSMIVWAVLFVAAVVLVAGWRGLRSVVGLVLAFVILLGFTLPSILDGHSPVAVAIVSAAAILFVVIYLAHGVSLRTSAALVGTLSSLALAVVLSWAAVRTMKITGLAAEQTTSLQVYSATISADGILLAGFIIGALGVLNDVTITQASAVFELVGAGESSARATFAAAMRVGRDHIASTVYTLVFAYAGSALPTLLLFSVAGQSFTDLMTTDVIAVELARSFVGGIAIAMSVPLTTVVAVGLAWSGRSKPTPGVRDVDRPAPVRSAAPAPAPARAPAPAPAPVRRPRHAMPD